MEAPALGAGDTSELDSRRPDHFQNQATRVASVWYALNPSHAEDSGTRLSHGEKPRLGRRFSESERRFQARGRHCRSADRAATRSHVTLINLVRLLSSCVSLKVGSEVIAQLRKLIQE